MYNRGSDGRRDEAYGALAEVGAYPVFGRYYQQITNFGSPGHPVLHRDPKEHLEEMSKVYHSPDPVLEQLTGITDQQKQDLMEFENNVRDADFGPLEEVKQTTTPKRKKIG